MTATRAALESAIARKAFARSFRGKAVAGPELADLVDRLLERAALSALSFANKAGQVITGFAKVEIAVDQGRAAMLIHASDAAADGVAKLAAAARPSPRGVPLSPGCNWTWRSGGQMWYTLPCSRTRRAGAFSNTARSLNAGALEKTPAPPRI